MKQNNVNSSTWWRRLLSVEKTIDCDMRIRLTISDNGVWHSVLNILFMFG